VLASLAISQAAWPASLVEIDAARVKGLAYLFQSQKGDGSWSVNDNLKVQTTATVLEALIHAGLKTGETYGTASAWLANAETASVDSTARKIAALAGTGMNMKPYAQALLAARSTSDRQAWGAYPQYEVSFPDTPLGITAVRLSGYSYANQLTEQSTAVACEILPSQRTEASGKGWSYCLASQQARHKYECQRPVADGYHSPGSDQATRRQQLEFALLPGIGTYTSTTMSDEGSARPATALPPTTAITATISMRSTAHRTETARYVHGPYGRSADAADGADERSSATRSAQHRSSNRRVRGICEDEKNVIAQG